MNIASSSLQPQSVKVQLIDVAGRMVSNQQMITSNANPAIMPVQGHRAGLYYIIIHDGQKSVKQKIVIADR